MPHSGTDAPPDTPQRELRPARRRSRSGGKLLFESVLIIGSIALGFIVTEWRAQVADRDLSHRILSNIANEVADNRERLTRQIEHHEAMLAAMAQAPDVAPEASGWETIMRTLASGVDALPMRQAAWDAAVSSGALRVIDYDVASRLSEIYVLQSEGYGRSVERISGALFVPRTFAPGSGREVMQMFRAMLGELLGAESYLRDTYDRHLDALRQAADEGTDGQD